MSVRGCNHHPWVMYVYRSELYIFCDRFVCLHTGCIGLALWLLYDLYLQIYAWAWQNWGPKRNYRYSDSFSDTQVTHCCCRPYLIWTHSWKFDHAKYFCWKRENCFMFLSQFGKVSSDICCVFLCPSMAYKWVCSDGLPMLPLEVIIKSWFVSFLGLSKETHMSLSFWNHSTQRRVVCCLTSSSS